MKSNIAITVLLGVTLVGFFAIYPIVHTCASDEKACASSPSITPTEIPPTLTCTPTPEELTPTTTTAPTVTPQISTAASADSSDKEAGNSGEIQAPITAPATGKAN